MPRRRAARGASRTSVPPRPGRQCGSPSLGRRWRRELYACDADDVEAAAGGRRRCVPTPVWVALEVAGPPPAEAFHANGVPRAQRRSRHLAGRPRGPARRRRAGAGTLGTSSAVRRLRRTHSGDSSIGVVWPAGRRAAPSSRGRRAKAGAAPTARRPRSHVAPRRRASCARSSRRRAPRARRAVAAPRRRTRPAPAMAADGGGRAAACGADGKARHDDPRGAAGARALPQFQRFFARRRGPTIKRRRRRLLARRRRRRRGDGGAAGAVGALLAQALAPGATLARAAHRPLATATRRSHGRPPTDAAAAATTRWRAPRARATQASPDATLANVSVRGANADVQLRRRGGGATCDPRATSAASRAERVAESAVELAAEEQSAGARATSSTRCARPRTRCARQLALRRATGSSPTPRPPRRAAGGTRPLEDLGQLVGARRRECEPVRPRAERRARAAKVTSGLRMNAHATVEIACGCRSNPTTSTTSSARRRRRRQEGSLPTSWRRSPPSWRLWPSAARARCTATLALFERGVLDDHRRA